MILAEEQFNYGELNDQHKKAAQEVLNLLEIHKDPLIVKELVTKHFQLVPKPKHDHSTSPFLAACEKTNMPANLQGWVEENGTLYPLFVFSGDIREFDKLFYAIKAQ